MNSQEILDAIKADADMVMGVNEKDTALVAKLLSEKFTEVVETNGGIGVVLETLGPVEGATVLEALDALRSVNPAIKWAFFLIERSGLNFGSPVVRGMIDQLASQGVWSVETAAKLKSIAEKPATITEFDVRRAVYADNGEVLV